MYFTTIRHKDYYNVALATFRQRALAPMKRAMAGVSLQLLRVICEQWSCRSSPRVTLFIHKNITFKRSISYKTVPGYIHRTQPISAFTNRVAMRPRIWTGHFSARTLSWGGGCAPFANMTSGGDPSRRRLPIVDMSCYVYLLTVFYAVALAAAGIMGDECDWTGR